MRRALGTRMLVGFFLLAAVPGCTTAQLRRTTINQVGTVHDIYQQQVLDNLAMFVHNRGSYPYFSLIGTGTTTLTDTATLADTNGWGRNAKNILLYTAAGFNPTLSRAKMGSWATFPINDSVKLTVMRCVYHAAMDGCLSAPGQSCPDCANLFYAYYNMEPPPGTGSNSIPYHGGQPNDPMDPSNTPFYPGISVVKAAKDSSNIKTSIPFGVQDQFKGYTLRFPQTGDSYLVESSNPNGTASAQTTTLTVSPPLITDHDVNDKFTLVQKKRPPIRGIVTPECLAFQQGWFCHGPKLPKHFDKCTPFGYYCGTYVWVPPGGIDQLTKLVLLVQDLAYYDPPQAGSQTVTTQKTANTPGPKTGSLASLNTTLTSLNNMKRDWQSINPLGRFDALVMPWGDGSKVPTTGKNLVVVGIDNNKKLHIRIFDTTTISKPSIDTDETKLPPAQEVAIANLRRRLPGLLPPHVLTDDDKAIVIKEATTIVGYIAPEEALKNRLQEHIQALQTIADQPDGSTQTTTTTTTTNPSSRQPTTFQPSILNLQQDLNLLPPRQ